MKKCNPLVLLILSSIVSLLTSCNLFNQTPSLDEAQEYFIEECQIMTKEEALSKEIGYYQDPVITERTFIRHLTGKDVIHEMNLLLKENEEETTSIIPWITVQWNEQWINTAKNYAVKHPDEIIAAEFHFTGIFTTYSEEDKYETYSRRLLFIYKPVNQWWCL